MVILQSQGGSPRTCSRIRVYFDELMPTDPVERVILYTHGWQSDFHDPTLIITKSSFRSMIRVRTRKAIELAEPISIDADAIDRALDRFIVSEGKTVFPFACRLAEIAPSWVTLQGCAGKGRTMGRASEFGFFRWTIAGTDSCDPKTGRECIRLALLL